MSKRAVPITVAQFVQNNPKDCKFTAKEKEKQLKAHLDIPYLGFTHPNKDTKKHTKGCDVQLYFLKNPPKVVSLFIKLLFI